MVRVINTGGTARVMEVTMNTQGWKTRRADGGVVDGQESGTLAD
jgi:hypothetical protein